MLAWINENRLTILIALLLIEVQVAILGIFGQPPICTCGYVKLWESSVLGNGNSQHLSDWYSLSHIVHGFIFFFLLRALFPRMSTATRLLFAMGIEVAWEVFENTPFIIERYREQALAQGYSGDSILNSVSDTVMMLAGFFAASRLRSWVIVCLIVVFELVALYAVRDNLTLNIINLIYPIQAVHDFQSGLISK